MKKLVVLIVLINVFFACSDDPKPKPKLSMAEMQEALFEANINATKLESEQIDAYLSKNKLTAIKTGTGLRYVVTQNGEGNSPKEESVVKIIYTVSLLNGTECYSTEGKAEGLTVGKSYAESGLQEALTYLKEGDKAIVIIPSHLAHGLAGDLNKIPIRATIIYKLELVEVK